MLAADLHYPFWRRMMAQMSCTEFFGWQAHYQPAKRPAQTEAEMMAVSAAVPGVIRRKFK